MLRDGYSVAELVIMGFHGPRLSPETRKLIQKEGATQFILFSNAKNYESKEQLIELTDELQSLNPNKALPSMVSVDQEGGRVQRFITGFTRLPTAKRVGEINSPKLAFELAQIQAKELFAAGIQLNFAPVCDINTNINNPVIGDRAYSFDEETVTRMSSASVRGHLTEHVECCIKHFPGHGDTHVDSHFDLPVVNTTLETLRKREWIPFQKAMKSGANFVMSAHVMLPHLDPDRPGTLSQTFMKKYLREELLFKGVVVSDDMQMHAITKNYGVQEAPILALQAGCDLLCYRSEDQSEIAIEAIKKGLKDKQLQASTIEASIDRVRKVRGKLMLAKNEIQLSTRLQIIGCEEHRHFIEGNF